MKTQNATINEMVQTDSDRFLAEWLAEAKLDNHKSKTSDARGVSEAKELLNAFSQGIQLDGEPSSFDGHAWTDLRGVLGALSSSRAAQGVSSEETSRFVLAMKKPLFSRLQARHANDAGALMDTLLWVSSLVDKMAQFTVGTYQRTREEIINRQQHELLELSTPVIKLWDGVLAVPMIGTLDSNRTQLVMEALLQRIVETGSDLAIIDITGVPTVDTLVAQHLLKTVAAIRLMGAECIISGIRPQIAQTIVHLGIDLQGVTTKATLADALALALKTSGYTVSRAKA
jgi:rsbT co-antagonist protein RsbR